MLTLLEDRSAVDLDHGVLVLVFLVVGHVARENAPLAERHKTRLGRRGATLSLVLYDVPSLGRTLTPVQPGLELPGAPAKRRQPAKARDSQAKSLAAASTRCCAPAANFDRRRPIHDECTHDSQSTTPSQYYHDATDFAN